MDAETNHSQVSKTPASKRFDLSVVFLRLLTLFATVSAAVVMAIDRQTKTFVVATIGTVPIQATLTAKFQHTPAFVFFVLANGLASLHNFLVLVVGILGTKWLSLKGLVPLLAITVLDLMNVVVVSGGASAAAFMGQLGRDGNSHTRWNKICDKFSTFCDHAGGAIIASFFGLMLMTAISVINVFRIKNNHYNKLVANSSAVP